VVDFGEVPLAVTGSPVPTVTAAAAQALAVRVKVPLMVGVDGYSGWDGRPLAAASPKLVYGFPSVDQPVPTPQRLMWRTVVCPASLVARLERQDKPERLELELDAHTGAVLYRYFLAAEPKEEPAGPRADRDWPAVAKQANGGRPFGAMLGVDPVSKCLSRCFAAGWLPGSDAKWERDVDRRARVSFAWQRGEVKALLVADVPDEGGGRLGLRLEGPSQGKDGTWLPLQPAGEALQWLQAMACEVLSPAVTAELLRPETRRRFHLQARERVLAGHGSVPWYEIETRGRRVQVFGAAGPASVVVRLEIEETLLEEALRQLDRAREPTR
jgi:hypothetical protein